MGRLRPVSPEQYARIFRVIYSVLEATGSRTERACIMFSLAGAAILRHHHRLDANPAAGALALCVGSEGLEDRVFSFGRKGESGELEAAPDAFHCWVECDGHIIDFMAPAFQSSANSAGLDWIIPARMLQQPLGWMATSLGEVTTSAGRFQVVHDQAMTVRTVMEARPGTLADDLVQACLAWYSPPPAPIQRALRVRNERGGEEVWRLDAPAITGTW